MLIVDQRLRIPLRELEFRFVRSGGPGGQNVNKVNSKAVLRWNAAASPSLSADARQRLFARFPGRVTKQGDVVLACDRFRDRRRNADECLEKLRVMLAAVAAPPRPRKRTKPGRASVEARLAAKRLRARRKQERRTSAERDR